MKTTHAYRDYVFHIEYEPKDPAYTVELIDISKIITSGSTPNEPFGNAREPLHLHLESLQKLESHYHLENTRLS